MQDETRPLQQALMELLKQNGALTSPEVERAFLTVPRHLFLPGEPVERAYQDIAIQVRAGPDGRWTSSSSQPSIMAIMLEQLALRPGMRVLEIGAGTGYNAALMAVLVGPGGSVTAVDIQPDLVEAAREHLLAAGIENARAVHGDGGYGWPAGAPYDRVILTASSATIAPAWREQLAPGGRLVLPFDLGGMQVSTAFEKRAREGQEELVSLSLSSCGFMPLQGGFAMTPTWINLAPRVSLACTSDPGWDAAAVLDLLSRPGEALPVGLRLKADELWSGLLTWLAVHAPDRGCNLTADDEALAALDPPLPVLRSALISYSAGEVTARAWLLLPAEQGAVLLRRHSAAPASRTADEHFDLEVVPLGEGEGAARQSAARQSAARQSAARQSAARQSAARPGAVHQWIDILRAWDAAGRPRVSDLRIRAVAADTAAQLAPGERLLARPWTDFMVGYG